MAKTIRNRLLLLNLGLVTLTGAAESTFLFFSPHRSVSPDGKYVLAAFKTVSPTCADVLNYHYASVDGMTVAIVSDPVFESPFTPDIRTLGPAVTLWSTESRAVFTEEIGSKVFPKIVGNLVGTQYDRRKSSEIKFHRMTYGDDGKPRFMEAPVNWTAIEEVGLAALKERVVKLGYNPETDIHDGHLPAAAYDFVQLSPDGQKVEDLNRYTNSFEFSHGAFVRVTKNYEIYPGGDSDNSLAASYQVIAQVQYYDGLGMVVSARHARAKIDSDD